MYILMRGAAQQWGTSVFVSYLRLLCLPPQGDTGTQVRVSENVM